MELGRGRRPSAGRSGMSLRPLAPEDCAPWASAWERAYGSRFAVAPEDLLGQALQHPLLIPEASGSLDGEAWIAVKRAPHGRLFAGTRAPAVQISAWAGRTWEAMEAALAESLKAVDAETIGFGQDHGSFWPGVPEHLLDRFEGWEIGGEEADVERDLAGYRPYPGCLEAMGQTVECRPARPEDEAILERFLVQEFPGRWHYDAMRKLALEPEEIDLLIEDGACVGFSYTQSPRSSRPIGGARWRLSLGPEWRTLGPIGVSESVRGRGLGHALLGASLQRMAESGGRQCLIDWTTLLGFYGRHGFQPTRIYRPASKRLQTAVDA